MANFRLSPFGIGFKLLMLDDHFEDHFEVFDLPSELHNWLYKES